MFSIGICVVVVYYIVYTHIIYYFKANWCHFVFIYIVFLYICFKRVIWLPYDIIVYACCMQHALLFPPILLSFLSQNQ